MRVNIYAEELTDKVMLISKEIDGQQYTGVRFWLELPTTIGHESSGKPINVKGPFMHRIGDDDSSAITFWGKQDLRKLLQNALTLLNEHYAQKEKK